MTTRDREVKSELIQVKITPTMAREIERMCVIERRLPPDWIRLLIENAIQQADEKATPRMRKEEMFTKE